MKGAPAKTLFATEVIYWSNLDMAYPETLFNLFHASVSVVHRTRQLKGHLRH